MKPLVKYSCTQSIMYSKIRLYDRKLLHDQKLFSIINQGRIVLSNQNRNLKKYSEVFLKHYQIKVIWRKEII